MRQRPSWLDVQTLDEYPEAYRPVLARLDAGEREAIGLVLQLQSNLLMIDERLGRKAAAEIGLVITGTIGVLVAASRAGLLDLRDALERLRRTNFRISNAMLNSLLADEQQPPELAGSL